MIRISVSLVLFSACWMACGGIYQKDEKVSRRSQVDNLLAAGWKAAGLPFPKEASDSVFVRRIYLDLLGRLPSPEEARAYLQTPDADALADRLLADSRFAEYWTMRWSEILRVKSEFPINLWPNAVYDYTRRIHDFLAKNEPYDAFARALLLSQGSNFRVPEVNFYRAMDTRTPEGIAASVALVFLGSRTNNFSDIFRCVAYKGTKEWKEEIVYVTTDTDRRAAFTEHLLKNPQFAKAAVNRAWAWLFGRGLVDPADDMPAHLCVNPALLDFLARRFVSSRFDYRAMLRSIVTCAAYRASPFAAGNCARSAKFFAVYPVRRLDAEVLADAIGDLSGIRDSFTSIIPEPYTNLPKTRRTIDIEDGSINNAFLVLFGRPARDTGLMEERLRAVNAKQRLYLFNSREFNYRLLAIPGCQRLKALQFPQKVEELYWLFLSRSPTPEEKECVVSEWNSKKGREKWQWTQDLVWTLANSEEFVAQH